MAICLSATNVQALTITTDPQAFADALAGLTLETESFESLGSVDESAVDLGALRISSGDLLDDSFAPTCKADAWVTAIGDAIIEFDRPRNAVGVFLGGSSQQTFTIAIDGVRLSDVFSPAGAITFVGLYDVSTPFASVSIASLGQAFKVDDVTHGSNAVAPVPAPAALPLLLAGVSGVGLLARGRAWRRSRS